jgi:hypothetical protein
LAYRRLARYRSEGREGLEPRSRRPHRLSTRITDRYEDEIVALRKELGFEIVRLVAQHLDASRSRADGSYSRSMLDAVLGQDSKPCAAFHLDIELVAPELIPELGWGIDDHCL